MSDDWGWVEKLITGGTAAAGLATSIAGLTQSAPKVSSGPRAIDEDKADAAAREKRQRAMASKTKTRATGLTGGLGISGKPATTFKTLFGGN